MTGPTGQAQAQGGGLPLLGEVTHWSTGAGRGRGRGHAGSGGEAGGHVRPTVLTLSLVTLQRVAAT